MKFDTVIEEFELNAMKELLSKMCVIKGNKWRFADCVKKLEYWHAFGRLYTDLIQTWYGDRRC